MRAWKKHISEENMMTVHARHCIVDQDYTHKKHSSLSAKTTCNKAVVLSMLYCLSLCLGYMKGKSIHEKYVFTYFAVRQYLQGDNLIIEFVKMAFR